MSEKSYVSPYKVPGATFYADGTWSGDRDAVVKLLSEAEHFSVKAYGELSWAMVAGMREDNRRDESDPPLDADD